MFRRSVGCRSGAERADGPEPLVPSLGWGPCTPSHPSPRDTSAGHKWGLPLSRRVANVLLSATLVALLSVTPARVERSWAAEAETQAGSAAQTKAGNRRGQRTRRAATETVASTPAAASPARDQAGGRSTKTSSNDVAAEIDRLIGSELQQSNVSVADRCSDEDFLRRVSFDLAGVPPLPHQITVFGLDPSPNKRSAAIDRLLDSREFAENWSSYWRDAIFMNATNQRARPAAQRFQAWMTEQLVEGKAWDEIVTALLTASGDVQENGATALLFAHDCQAEEVAAEASRLFLGIQMQCANCHDHPSDIWKRNQFHELAAYFPRIALRPVMEDGRIRSFEVVSVNQERPGPQAIRENADRIVAQLDRNKDGKVSKAETQNAPRAAGLLARAFDRLLEVGDADDDGMLSAKELKQIDPPAMPNNGSTEHYMEDLKDPTSRGTVIQPKFFVDQSQPGQGLSDADRRAAAAKAFTDPANPWFAHAFVNRVWHELLGEAFYMPVDDLGPSRSPRYPQVLEVLSKGFVSSGYDIRWLLRTVALTEAYQRQIRPKAVSADESLPFAAQVPTRLRADQLFNSLTVVLGLEEVTPAAGPGALGGLYAAARSPRQQFHQIFAYDPSTPQQDLSGNIQQALLLMNTNGLRAAISASGNTRLGQILRKFPDDQDAVSEVYLLTLGREPTDQELQLCQAYLQDVGRRAEAYEDLLWGLINTSEFVSKR
jgi:hypothetical protein